jgi:glucokinase
MANYFIGIDWGGTRVKLGAATADGKLLHQEIIDTMPATDIEVALELLTKRIHGCITILGGRLSGIGLGLTGPVNPDLGVVLLPGKIKGLEGYPIVPQLRQEFGVPVWAENDGGVAMYAEKTLGLARGKKWAVVLTIGTGVGSGVMIDGRIFKDPHFMFGAQVGHLVIDTAHDQLCLTGARGTAEMLCSATALALAVRGGLQRGIPSILSERYWANPHAINFKAIMEEGVAKGDRLCMDEMNRWTRQVGWLLVNTVHAYSPEIIILAGGAMAAADAFLPALRQHVNAHVFRYPPGEPVPIEVSTLGDHVGVLGAIAMVVEKSEAKHE